MTLESIAVGHGERMYELGKAEGRSVALVDACTRLIELGHNTAAQVLIDLLNADRVRNFANQNMEIA